MPTSVDALEVLDRTLSALIVTPERAARARYLETNIGRWVADDPDPRWRSVRERLDGVDTLSAEDRLPRLAELHALVQGLRGEVGVQGDGEAANERAWQPRARLFPEGLELPAPPAPAPPARADGAPRPVQDGEAEPPRRGRGDGSPRDGGRSDGSRGEGGRSESNRSESNRSESNRSESNRSEGNRSEGNRPEGNRGEGRRGNHGRGGRAGTAQDEAATEAPAGESSAPNAGSESSALRSADSARPEPSKAEPPRAPEPPPEPKTWALGHPEDTGRPVATLGVFTDEELAALVNAGIDEIADLLTTPPVRIERAGERLVTDVLPEGPVLLRGRVGGRVSTFRPDGRGFQLRLATDREPGAPGVLCTWAGAPTDEILALQRGQDAGLTGRWQDGVLHEGEILGLDGRGGDWLPAYQIEGVSDRQVRRAVRRALARHVDALADHLPPELLERHKLLPLSAALRDVHFPPNQTRKGRSRMVFDELFQVQLGIALSRGRAVRERGVAHTIGHRLVAQALCAASWELTDGQEAAFDELRRDLRRKEPSVRLLQGDAGVGKQLVLQAAMLVACEAQSQVLYLAPDAVTAEERYLFGRGWFESVGLAPALWGPMGTRPSADALKKGEVHVVYATPAILESLPAFRRLGLVVVEEVGVYGGVDLGAIEVEGAGRPHVLVTTPTPVPSALALTVYGHLALTTIPGTPSKGVQTKVYSSGEREDAYAVVREALTAGQQAILAFPVRRGQEDLLSPSEARRIGEALESSYFPGARFAVYSGAMSREERFRVYDDFSHRRTDLLLATTCVEHGPPVPNCAVMLVENAQAVDVVRLHRLRAHVAGGLHKGRCLFVLGEDPAPEAQRALDLVVAESSGQAIAELDLEQRGLAAVLGEHAPDLPGFAWADPVQDRDQLLKTRQEALKLLAADPGLKRRAVRPLLYLVRARFGEELGADAPAAPQPASPAGKRRKRRRR